jgi:hypothetical protein
MEACGQAIAHSHWVGGRQRHDGRIGIRCAARAGTTRAQRGKDTGKHFGDAERSPWGTRSYALVLGQASAVTRRLDVMSADGGRLMADWRKIGDVMVFWIYAEFGAIPIRKEIDHVKKWRGMLARANGSSDG